jgi:GLPGLI family protein
MHKIIFFLAFSTLSFFGACAQNFQGQAVYESKTSNADMKARLDANKNITPEMRKMIEERTKSMFERTFTLDFDKTASMYQEEEKLDAPGQEQGRGGMRMMAAMMGGGPTYKNVKTKTYAVANEFMGKEFLIKDSLPKIAWKMESETKQIGNYTCYKATAVMPASKSDFRNYRLRRNADKNGGDPKTPDKPDDKADAPKKTNFMDDVALPKEITVTAWYAPEIPVSQGPEKYWGLPGLILEINDGKTTILCSKIVLNPKDKAEIKEPTTGKVVTQKEYDDIVIKKTEEMREQFQQNRANGGHGNMRFGG